MQFGHCELSDRVCERDVFAPERRVWFRTLPRIFTGNLATFLTHFASSRSRSHRLEISRVLVFVHLPKVEPNQLDLPLETPWLLSVLMYLSVSCFTFFRF